MYEDFQRELVQYRLENNIIVDPNNNSPNEPQNEQEKEFLKQLYLKYYDMVGGRVRSVVTGGASTSQAVLQFLNRIFEWPCSVSDGYGSTETGAIMIDNTIVRGVDFKIISVPEMGYYDTDKPHARGELCVKTPSMFVGYIGDKEQTSSTVDEEGYVHTGDIVEHHGGRRCVIIDRKKSILKLAQGEFVAPEGIENVLIESPLISQAYVYGSSVKSFVLAVIVPNWELLKQCFENLEQNDPQIKEKILEEIRTISQRRKLQVYQIPRDILIEYERFSHEAGHLTSIGKIARYGCEKIYKVRLEEMYEKWEQDERNDVAGFVNGVLDRGTDEQNEPLSSMGVDSLHAVRMASIIKSKYNVDLDAKTLMGDITVDHITDLILNRGKSKTTTRSWDEELTLEEINVPMASIPHEEMIQLRDHANVLLSGCTGFLGTFLLDQLLSTTLCRVHCIVRAREGVSPIDRIKQSMRYHERIIPNDFDGRVIAHDGDLAKENFGLDQEQFSQLCEQIRIIYHNGAHVNSLYSYNQLKAENVGGTRQIIKLATTGPLKVIHYVSTISVVRTIPTNLITEDCDVSETQEQLYLRLDRMGGYAASKMVAEKLLRQVRAKGVPVTIYRPGMIGADSETGCCNMTDWVNRFIRACIVIGTFPKTNTKLNAVPVNIVADIIIRTSQLPESLALPCYNVVNHIENDVPFDTILGSIPNLKQCNFKEWMSDVECLLQNVKEGPVYDALWPMISLFKNGFPSPGTPVANDNITRLANINLRCLNEEEINAQVDFMKRNNLV
jgi:fatty acid CoA ligase FadD9